MHDAMTRLLELLDLCERGLTEHRERQWAEWIATSARRLRDGDRSGLGYFLAAFGGMGSINDIVVEPALRAQLSEAYDLAFELNGRRRH